MVSPMQYDLAPLIYVLLQVLAVVIALDTASSVFSALAYSLAMLRKYLPIDD